MDACNKLGKTFKQVSVHVDDRDDYSAGWKFNEWELYGVPVRVEIGPRDLDKGECVLVRRDTGKKKSVKLKNAEKEIQKMLKAMHKAMYEKAKKNVHDNRVVVKNKKELKKAIDNKKLVIMPWCEKMACEELLKFDNTGAKVLCKPFDQPKKKPTKCGFCGKPAKAWWYVAKSY